MTNGYSIRVRGQVQGVGFRPFIWQLAHELGLTGDVRNDPEGVLIHICGDSIDVFLERIETDAPPLARVDLIESAPFRFDDIPADFILAKSEGTGAETRVTPDAATCDSCLDEIRGDGRRADYAFTNCTHCGPRYSILRKLPYDRHQTTMAPFEMCAACRAEYEDPADRRFHAQPIACPVCGPEIWMERDGTVIKDDVIAVCARALLDGEVVAIKGIGGFHLACDATSEEAINLLRARKRRPTKPFALMGDEALVAAHCEVTEAEWALLKDAAAPIVLMKRHDTLPDALAPGMDTLGFMLPYTPLHHLLVEAVGRPLIMTSGNLSGEPQAIGNDEAREKLTSFVDGFLFHNRDIARRLDDSVERMTPYGPMVLRRARGCVPDTRKLPPGFENAPDCVAYGGQLKSAICLTKNGQALLSHHMGDLDNALTVEEFEKADRDYADLFDHTPTLIACDLHEGYRSSIHAAARGESLVQVQHHHAHLASVMGENGWPLHGGKVIGIILDGLGLGDDGTIWGGELLLGDYTGYERRAHLKPAPLIGGEAAQREPWRNTLMRLDQAGLTAEADRLFADKPLALLRQAAVKGINAPLSSSVGRLFDAFASLLFFEDKTQSFEGEAAMVLESIATPVDENRYHFPLIGKEFDPAPLFEATLGDIQKGRPQSEMAFDFHRALAVAFCGEARRLVEAGAADAVALSGGCFQNELLLSCCMDELQGLTVLNHERVPANDGGLAFGQALIAAAQQIVEPEKS